MEHIKNKMEAIQGCQQWRVIQSREANWEKCTVKKENLSSSKTETTEEMITVTHVSIWDEAQKDSLFLKKGARHNLSKLTDLFRYYRNTQIASGQEDVNHFCWDPVSHCKIWKPKMSNWIEMSCIKCHH